MSQQPPPRSNFIQILLIGMMVFLGYQLITAPSRATPDNRKASEVFAELQQHHRDLMDVTMMRELRTYEKKVREEDKANSVPETQTENKILIAYALTADTIRKSGLYRHELYKAGRVDRDYGYKKLDKAYVFFKPKQETYYLDERWSTLSVPITPTPEVPATELTPKDIYSGLVKQLSPLAEAEPVWGFIPGFQLIDFLVQMTGAVPGFSYWFAALLLAIAVRAVIWPLVQKQIMWGRQMQQLKPRIDEIKEKYMDKKTKQVKDPAAFQADTLALYKTYGINPAAGCLPALIQMPLFLAVYQAMHHYKFEFVNGTFLWINPDSTRFLNIPIAPNLGERDYILVGVYMISMIASTMLMPVTDPSNYKQQRMIGLGIAVFFSIIMFFYSLPSAFILYWIFTNILSTAQSLISYRLPAPELKEVQSVKGGFLPNIMEAAARQAEERGDSKPINGKTNGQVSPDFFGKTGTPKANKAKKKPKK
ncbi:YidC/Oxa1 family membrane protein insertase [Kamptonema cortianum]|nr:YidC/Oxa1 family membrane protein insertase [Geitlerinema splendidum]MDK3160961.1 YidC/Oxa1 family membrane protein insertase [Kamptonema cortianum]